MSSLGHVTNFKTFTVSHSTWASWPQENVFLVTSTLYLCTVFVVVSVSNCNSWKMNKLLVKMQMAGRSVWFWLSEKHQRFQLGIFDFHVKFMESIKSPHCNDNISWKSTYCLLRHGIPLFLKRGPLVIETLVYRAMSFYTATQLIRFLWEWGLDKLHSQYPSSHNDATSMSLSTVLHKDEIRPVLFM